MVLKEFINVAKFTKLSEAICRPRASSCFFWQEQNCSVTQVSVLDPDPRQPGGDEWITYMDPLMEW
jgi:hypothetical protein